MKVKFVGNQLSFMNNNDDKVRITTGAILTVGEDLPEETFERFAHKFQLMDAPPPLPEPQARVMVPAAIRHTGGGWYTVVGHEGKYRKAEAEALANA